MGEGPGPAHRHGLYDKFAEMLLSTKLLPHCGRALSPAKKRKRFPSAVRRPAWVTESGKEVEKGAGRSAKTPTPAMITTVQYTVGVTGERAVAEAAEDMPA